MVPHTAMTILHQQQGLNSWQNWEDDSYILRVAVIVLYTVKRPERPKTCQIERKVSQATSGLLYQKACSLCTHSD